MQETEAKPVQERRPVLYHYCSVESLRSIVLTRKLWLTNLFYLNDNLEHLWLRNVAAKFLNTTPDSPKRRALLSVTAANYGPHIYCTSFSQEKDRLSQWRAYSADGCGVSIGFNANYFPNDMNLVLEKVVYDEQPQLEIVRKLVGLYDQEATLPQRSPFNEPAITFGVMLWYKAASCKNPAFEEEHEWRLIYRPPEMVDGPLGNPFPELGFGDTISPLEFRTRSSALVPYFSLPFSKEEFAKSINVIWVGPKGSSKGQIDAIKYLLRSNGLPHVEVEASKASYC